MENTMVDPNQKIIFHPTYSDNPGLDQRQKVAEHVGKHYRKYLFSVGALSGFMIAFTARIFFGTSDTTRQASAGYETLTPEVNAIIIFNQMDAIAHEKDNFFHQTGKIYTLNGETLFHKYDTMFHVLDNAFHRAIDTTEKLKRAQRLEAFIKIQNNIFAATEYSNPAQDKQFDKLDQQFLQILDQIPTTENSQQLTGTIIAQ